jgi:hypothetical protein
MAGCDMLKGAASSATFASPSVSRARIARRVGSASALNTESSWSGVNYNCTLLECLGYRLSHRAGAVNRVAGSTVCAWVIPSANEATESAKEVTKLPVLRPDVLAADPEWPTSTVNLAVRGQWRTH